MSEVVIQGGLVIDPLLGAEHERDILIEGDVVRGVEQPGTFRDRKAARIIDARGHWVTPGFVDIHVHLREPGFEWKETIESGVRAAALGGVTTVCAMPNTRPTNDNAEVTQFVRKTAERVGLSHVLPIGAVTVGLHGAELAPLSELYRAGCVAFSDDGEPVANAGIMRRALEWAAMHGLTISCHEEDKSLSCGGCMNEGPLSYRMGLAGWHAVAEEVMIARDIELARAFNGRVHICHVSTARGAELIRRAKHDGISVTAEVTPHHLVLTEDDIGDYDTNYKMSPPLRTKADVSALRAALADGTIDAIASDHAPHDRDTKLVEFQQASFGILGLQTSLPLTLDLVRGGILTRLRAIEVLTSGPSRCFSLSSGTLTVGRAADISIINPEHRWCFDTVSCASLSYNSPFMGRDLCGRATTVLASGRIIVANGEIV